MNYHFNPANQNRQSLIKELQEIDRDLDISRKKLTEQKKLQNQFYEDQNSHKNLNLADDIMNELLKANKSSTNVPKVNNFTYEQPKMNMYENINNFNPSNQNNQFQNHYNNGSSKNNNNNFHNQNKMGIQHENRFINKREIQKQKLQNKQMYQQNPFLSNNAPVRNSAQRNNKFRQPEPKPIINERQLQKIKLQQGNNQEYPFRGQNNRSYEKYKQQPTQINQVYENPRELQKIKLQQKLHQYNQNNQYTQNNQYNQLPEKDISNNNVSKNLAYENRYSNPFVKDEQFIKQKRQQQQRQYRRVLEEQKKIEEQRKNKQKQIAKQQKYAFNNYTPVQQIQKNKSIQNVSVKKPKKIDPNSGHPTFNYSDNQNYTSPSDLEFMKMKVTQFKEKYKKGRIHYDQYFQQIKKLAEYYKTDYKQFIDKKDLPEQEQLPWIAEGKKKQETNPKPVIQNNKQNNNNNQFQIIQNQQSLQRIPDSQSSFHQEGYRQQYSPITMQNKNIMYQNNGYQNIPQSNNPNLNNYYSNPNIYTQNAPPLNVNPQMGLNSTAFIQQFPQMDYDLMRRMFDELKAMRNDYTKSLQSQKTFLQDTFIKLMSQMQQQQLISTNQSQQLQNIQSNSNVPQNKITQMKNSSPKPNKKHNNFVLQSSSQNNITDQSLQMIQKSLSGIINKIPLSKNQQQRSFVIENTNKKQKKPQNLQKFFNKPYKTKKFKKFPIMIDISQSQMQVPNLSNFIALKNGKDILNRLFEQDLIIMKKLQRQKQVKNLRNKLDQHNNYQATFNKNQINPIYQTNNKSKSYQNQPSINTNLLSNNQSRNTYQQYENYSRNPNSKERDIKSAHLNHRSYRKVQSHQDDFPSNAFIKKHVSTNQEQQNFPNFSDQSDIKVRSPVYYSPKLNSEILEQDQYQTQQKSKPVCQNQTQLKSKQILQNQFYGNSHISQKYNRSPQTNNKKYEMKKKNYIFEQIRDSQKKQYQQRSVEKIQISDNKTKINDKQKNQKVGMMKVLESNNQVLEKYQQSINRKSIEDVHQEIDIKQYSSINSNLPKEQQQLRNYFSNINNNSNKSKQSKYLNNKQSKQLSNKFNSQQYQYNNINQYNSQYEESLQTVKSQEQSVKLPKYKTQKRSISPNKKSISPNKSQNKQQQNSIQYSQSYNSINKRPGPASINISQTIQSIEQSSSRLQKPPLSKKKSTSKKKQSSITRTKFQKDSVLYKPPQSSQYLSKDSQYVIEGEKLKFDSNVYESQYDETVDANMLHNKINQLQKQSQNYSQLQNNLSKPPQINLNPPVYIMPKQSASNLFLINNQNQRPSGSNLISASGKLKSLEEARNLAKQSKKKASVTIPQQNYEQKMSELQSFLTRRDQSIPNLKEDYKNKQSKNVKLGLNKKSKQESKKQSNKNIMNLLDDLENQSVYRDDFQSYRQQSEYIKQK